jgi:metallo-beta-lactamase family protein
MPLYDEADAHRALGHFHPVGFHRQIEVADGVTVEFMGSGHLLGSAYVVARLSGGTTILFGGDLGRYGRPVLPDPEDASAIGADVRIDAGSRSTMRTPIIRPMIRETSSRGHS